MGRWASGRQGRTINAFAAGLCNDAEARCTKHEGRAAAYRRPLFLVGARACVVWRLSLGGGLASGAVPVSPPGGVLLPDALGSAAGFAPATAGAPWPSARRSMVARSSRAVGCSPFFC